MEEDTVRQVMSAMGERGGTKGRGESKLRGDVNYYARISKLAAEARSAKARSAKAKCTTDKQP